MTTAQMQPAPRDVMTASAGWFVAFGILFIVGGILAIAAPIFASVFVAIMVGVSLAVAGAFQAFHAFQVKEWGTFLWQFLVGAIVLVGGGLIAFNPIAGAITLTWVFAVVWIAKGIMQIMFAWRIRPMPAWAWIFGAGVVAIVVGVLVLVKWPNSGLLVPGTLLGISLLFTGWSYLLLGFAGRRAMA